MTSAVLQDVAIVTEETIANVNHRNSVRRTRKNIRAREVDHLSLFGLYFVSRREKTLYQEKIVARYYKRTFIEEHISLIEQPTSQYVGHTIKTSNCGKQ